MKLIGDPVLANPTTARWFNTCALTVAGARQGCASDSEQPAFQILPANSLRLEEPSRGRLCRRTVLHGPLVLQEHPPAEEHDLQFRAELFNATNVVQWNAPNTTITSAQFGTVAESQANDPRNIMVSVRFSFSEPKGRTATAFSLSHFAHRACELAPDQLSHAEFSMKSATVFLTLAAPVRPSALRSRNVHLRRRFRKRSCRARRTSSPAGEPFTTLPGFKVERVVPEANRESLIMITFDAKGRPWVSPANGAQAGGPPKTLVDENGDGIYESS